MEKIRWFRSMKRLAQAIEGLPSALKDIARTLRRLVKILEETQQDKVIKSWGLQVNRTQNPLTANPRRYFSQADEDGILEEIIARTGTSKSPTFIEYGVGDGSECNTVALLSKGWSGIWVSGEELGFTPHTNGRLNFVKEWITADNIVSLTETALRNLAIQNVDVLSLDLDGNDIHFTRALLEYGIRPTVWIAEYNARFSPQSRWSMPYDPNHSWGADDYFGASLASLADLMSQFDYFPVACSAQGANVFFVSGKFAANFQDVPKNLEELYCPPLYRLAPQWGHRISAKTLRSLTES